MRKLTTGCDDPECQCRDLVPATGWWMMNFDRRTREFRIRPFSDALADQFRFHYCSLAQCLRRCAVVAGEAE